MDSSPNGNLFPFIYLHLLHRLQGPGGQQVARSKKEIDEFSKVPFKDSLDRIHGIGTVGHLRAGLSRPRPPMARGRSNQRNSGRVASRRAL